MEFPNLGKRCFLSDCKQLDFLFIKCDLCSEVFCKAHNLPNLHNCKHFSSLPKKEKLEVSGTLHHPCSLDYCTNSELTEISCPFCHNVFCLQHRHQIDHNCVEYKPPINPMLAADIKVKELISTLSDKPKRKINKKNAKLASKIQLMKLKGKAIGSSCLPAEERVYFSVHLPNSVEEIEVFVSNKWSVGRVIDAVADLGKVSNKNDDPTSPKLLLCMAPSSEPLMPLDRTFKSLMDEEEIFNGQAMYLDYFS